jgi:hypothetical protein
MPYNSSCHMVEKVQLLSFQAWHCFAVNQGANCNTTEKRLKDTLYYIRVRLKQCYSGKFVLANLKFWKNWYSVRVRLKHYRKGSYISLYFQFLKKENWHTVRVRLKHYCKRSYIFLYFQFLKKDNWNSVRVRLKQCCNKRRLVSAHLISFTRLNHCNFEIT